MPGNTFGKLFTITTFGESHGNALGVVIDGCPAGIELDLSEVNTDLQRRKPGQSSITTQRHEPEQFEVLSGLFEGKTTGMPLTLLVYNKNQKSKDYTYQQKYGFRDYRGGGRSSARETVSRVMAGSVAKQYLRQHGIEFSAFVSQVGHLKIHKPISELNLSLTEENIVRCPDPELAEQMIELIKDIRKEGDTVGGQITGVISGCSPGLGEPVFDKLHADLAKAMLSINAVKGFEYGSGFNCVSMKGSEHNDEFYEEDGVVKTKQNYSGGIQGGISNGMPIEFNVAFKPVATIMKDQRSIDKEGNEVVVKGKGRHDPCVVPRAVVIVEAMAALVIMDHYLRHKTLT